LLFSSPIIGGSDESIDIVGSIDIFPSNSIPNLRKWFWISPRIMQGCNRHATGKKKFLAMLDPENRLSIQTLLCVYTIPAGDLPPD
jgi:hypothetical protein